LKRKREIIISLSLILIAVASILFIRTQKIREEVEEELNISLPESRSFYMGMTPFPYDITPEAALETFKLVREHGDIVRIWFDTGIPWPEAFEGKPYHPNVEDAINSKLSQLGEGQRVYLSLTPISEFRTGLAGYWGEEENMERPGEWKNKGFDDPEIITAYINFCRYMIQKFKPDFMAYAIEVNDLAKSNPNAFDKFVILAAQVYKTLKKENPTLPIFLTIKVGTFYEDEASQRAAIEKVLPYTDYIVVSSYPFQYYADPKEIPEDWFSRIADLAPEKPFAVAETAFTAENVVIEKYGINIPGNERWQAEYLQILLTKANELNAKFVIWFCPVDYDLLWEKIKDFTDEGMKFWRDTGLINEKMEARPSLKIWDAWLKLPISSDK